MLSKNRWKKFLSFNIILESPISIYEIYQLFCILNTTHRDYLNFVEGIHSHDIYSCILKFESTPFWPLVKVSGELDPEPGTEGFLILLDSFFAAPRTEGIKKNYLQSGYPLKLRECVCEIRK